MLAIGANIMEADRRGWELNFGIAPEFWFQIQIDHIFRVLNFDGRICPIWWTGEFRTEFSQC